MHLNYASFDFFNTFYGSFMLKLSTAAIVKNEGEYLLEWFAYHWLVGVRYFLIADNESTDNTATILRCLHDLGIVSFVYFPTSQNLKPQLPAYQKLVAIAPKDIDLIAFIDADEFLVPLNGDERVNPFLDGVFSDESISALAMQWACFGSAGHLFKDDGMVIERFTRQSAAKFTANKNYKSVARPSAIKDFHNPHYINLRGGRYVNTMLEDLTEVGQSNGVSKQVVWEGIRVNHYVVKSLEEFVVGKSRKGSAASQGRVKHKKYFQNHDRNEEEWCFPPIFVEKVRDLTIRLAELVEVHSQQTKRATPVKLTKSQRKWRKIIIDSGTFEPFWYLVSYPDVFRAGYDPLDHYIKYGAAERRSPAEGFDPSYYLKQNPDVAKSEMNPFAHYLKFGRIEGRQPHA